MRLKQAAAQYDAAAIALDNAYAVAFHNGLGSPVFPASTAPYKKYLSDDHVAAFADAAYTRPNLAIVGDGANASTLSSWVERFFKDVPVSAQSGQSIKTEATKYFGGEQRQNAAVGNAITIAFPGSDYNNAKPEIAVLAALLGGKSTIKWSPGFSLLGKATAGLPDLQVATSNASYSDAGLFTIQISGAAASVRKAAFEAAKALKSVADGTVGKEDLEKAIANAKFDALNDSQLREPSTILAGAGLLNTGKPFELNALSKAIEGVTAQKLKTVRSLVYFVNTVETLLTNHVPPGCQGSCRWQGHRLSGRRPVCAPVRRGNRSAGVGGQGVKYGSLYQQTHPTRLKLRGAGLFVNTCSRVVEGSFVHMIVDITPSTSDILICC